MTFEQAKEIATLISGAGDQIVNLAILAIAGASAFVIKYGSRIARMGKICLSVGILLVALAAISSFIGKGLLITMLQKSAEGDQSTARLDDVSMFAFFQFAFTILGLIMLAAGVFLYFAKPGSARQSVRTQPASLPVSQGSGRPARKTQQPVARRRRT